MSVGPIEVIRAQEATQIRHIDAQRAQHAQEQLSKNFQNLVEHEQKKPVETTKTEKDEYNYDAREKGNGQYTGSGSKKKENEGKKESKDPKSTPKKGGIDILI